MNVIENEFRDAFRQTLKLIGAKQEDVADRAGISVSRLCRVLLAQTALDKRMLLSITKGLRACYADRHDIKRIQRLGVRRILSDLDLTAVANLRADGIEEWLDEEKTFAERPTPFQKAAIRRQQKAKMEVANG